MNKKAIGSVFVALALVLALLKSYIWVMVGLLIAAIVFACEERQTKRDCTVLGTCIECACRDAAFNADFQWVRQHHACVLQWGKRLLHRKFELCEILFRTHQMGGYSHQFLSDCICRFGRCFLLARQGYAALRRAYRCHLQRMRKNNGKGQILARRSEWAGG